MDRCPKCGEVLCGTEVEGKWVWKCLECGFTRPLCERETVVLTGRF